ncbi:MAG: hypothetical protein HY701_14495 [Gemmatimonadetes bacterium]|nr:hypothetical protein [Gemmatimonadota bacterium]
MRRRVWRSLARAGAVAALLCSSAQHAEAQAVVRDLVLTGGFSVESYQGRLPAVTVPIVDSTDRAGAAIGQVGGSGSIVIHATPESELTFFADAGLRQFAAQGFQLADYAPRELVGTSQLGYARQLSGIGAVDVTARFRGRRVEDRPPMPLFIEPGYGSARGSARVRFLPVSAVRFDAALVGEVVNYSPPGVAPHLDLLDRRLLSAEAGAEWGGEGYSLRFYSGYSSSSYTRQSSFDPQDPYRHDQAVRVGAGVRTQSMPFLASLGIEGALNRSNSRRPEYNAVIATTLVSAPLPMEFNVEFLAVLTAKSYLQQTPFARLVPGEEADNASLVFLSLSRPLNAELSAAVRVGWTRAETEIGNAYFQRYGATVFLHYRPGL